MIPQLPLQETIRSDCYQFLEKLAKTSFSGEIRADFASRLLMSTDNSIYQILPQAAVFPCSDRDLVSLFELAHEDAFGAIAFSPRGGGTGTNGQSLSPGIILDTSKYMNKILELNLDRGWVRVQPGVVLDELNAYLRPFGVFFAVSIAPSNRATVGGAIATDACGKGSRIYGRTSDNILELAWVLSDGTTGRSHDLDFTALEAIKKESTRLGQIYRQVDEIVTTKRELIEQTFPKMPRFMTGYNLAKISQKDSLNLNYLLAGSEGTLAVVTEAKLKLTPIPKYKALLAIHYRCFDDALLDAQRLLTWEPEAIETIDEKILELAKSDVIYEQVKDFILEARVINLVEFAGENLAEIEERVEQVCRDIEINKDKKETAIGYYFACDREEINNLWALRKRGVGLLGNLKGERKPIAFIEDTAVPPCNLASYIQEFKALLSQYKIDYAMYGHVDVGCLHVRPALDLKVAKDEALIRELSDKVVALVRKYGGVMWGEHGKGFRSEYTPVFFGEELYRDLRRIKTAFDSNNRLNPGKIVTPLDSNTEVVRVEAPLRGHFDRQVSATVRSQYEEAFSCNGNGACFNFSPDDVMCPSSKVTRDRIHSPKGRASLLKEWLRRLEAVKAEKTPKSAGFLLKARYSLGKAAGVYDYSHEVYEGMHGCLSCKACASQCPIHVNIPEMKAKFLEYYYSRYFRQWRDYFFGYSEVLASWQAQLPRLSNALTQNRFSHWFIKQFLKAIDPPAVSQSTVKQGLKDRQAPRFDLAQLSKLSEVERQNSVILWQDAFTSFYESQLVLDTYDLLSYLGYSVYVAPFLPSGKPLHVKGFLAQFKAIAQKNALFLSQLERLNIPIIGIEPSIVLTYRDEYFKVLSTEIPKIQLLQEFLVTQLQRLPQVSSSETYYLLGHCTEKTIAIISQKQWQQIFTAMEIPLNLVSTGCCGMAGIYGHEAEHYKESQGIYQMSWERKIPACIEERKRFLATGYSCRSQVERFTGFVPLHPIQAIARLTLSIS
jgi:FAD/FMN-containing dehydrogenase/Fe-S oxidoreductase